MKTILEAINNHLYQAALVKQELRQCSPAVAKIAEKMIAVFKKGKTVYFFGNGGSAADAQHFAAELVGHFQIRHKKPLPALALSANTALLTSLANDYGFEEIFSRQVRALVKKGDLVVAISTSGDSPNVLAGVKAARKIGAYTIGFTGQSGGKFKNIVDLCLRVPSDNVARIQECHQTVGHIICAIVERELSR